MILSGINFVKNKSCGNHDFSDFILGKIKEEQDRRDKKCLGQVQHPKCKKNQKLADKKEPDVQKENEANENILTTGDVIKQRLTPSTCEEVSHVSIETKDGYYLTIHTDRNLLYLSEDELPSKSSIFCQHMFKVHRDNNSDKKQHLVVFQLQCDPSRYMITTDDRKLDVMKYGEANLNPESPDERFFIVHQLDNGNVFLQPYAHKGYYIHHIDNNIFVRKLEINWRPPEEYFFKIEVVDLPDAEMESISASTSDIFSEINNNKDSTRQLIDVQLPQTPKQSLIFGCFGSRTKKSRSSKKNKR